VSIIIAILGFSLLIFVHELGHFIFARMTGMEVEKFSIGFGPALYQWGEAPNTVYQIALLPFGGFVQIKGLIPKSLEEENKAPVRTLKDIEAEWGMEGIFNPVDLDKPVLEAADPTPVVSTADKQDKKEDEDYINSFQSKALWARFLVVLGGPLFNFLFTMGVYWVLFASHQAFQISHHRTHTQVVKESSSVALKAGLKSGDFIEKINGVALTSFYDLRAATVEAKDQKVVQLMVARPPEGSKIRYQKINLHKKCLLIEKNRQEQFTGDCNDFLGSFEYLPQIEESWPRLTLSMTPQKISAHTYRLGITPELARLGCDNVLGSLQIAWFETWRLVAKMYETIKRGLAGDRSVEVASVVKITAISADTVRMGKEWFFNFLALLSLNLAFLNLLPLPALDGGRLIFLMIEAVSRRPVPPKIEMIVHGIGVIFLIIITIWVTSKDILSLM
jgi:regulator of sigma E protease